MNLQGSLGLFDPAVRFVAGRRLWVAVRGLALSAVLALLFFTPVAPAAAHDAIESSEPAEGSVVAAVPAAVKLAFSNTPIALGASVQIKDENGVDQAEGRVVITDNVVSQPVKAGAPAGTYTVTWRVVSSDSHPIEGQFTFIAGDTSGPSPSTAAPATTPTAGSETQPSAGAGWALVAGGAVLVAGLLATARSVRRRLLAGSGGPS
jgi:methionine-rich copper-binding protein CopC